MLALSSLDLEKLREKSEFVRISWFFFISFMWCICRSSCRSARVTCWCQLIDLRRLKWTWTKKPRNAWRVHNGCLHNSLPLRNRTYLKGRWLTTLIPQSSMNKAYIHRRGEESRGCPKKFQWYHTQWQWPRLFFPRAFFYFEQTKGHKDGYTISSINISNRNCPV